MAAYGTVHGMVFPILMFPAAILYSLSDLLLPELARCRAEGDARRIRALSERCLHLTTLFACGVAALEFLLAEPLGLLLYQSREAGMYLRLFAPLALILYPDAIVDGMCKGLGRQVSCVRNNTITSLMDIAMLWFLLPRLGMGGYILTFAVTHAVNFYLSLQLLTDASGCRVRPARVRAAFRRRLSAAAGERAAFAGGLHLRPVFGALPGASDTERRDAAGGSAPAAPAAAAAQRGVDFL